jgi:serine/threonine protein phosphatase PrpC
VKFATRTESHKVLVIGSDGLWEKMSDAALVSTVKKNLKDKEASEKICKELVNIAMNRWNKECIFYRDDICCITVLLNNKF